MSFEYLGLADETLKAVTDSGYETPTPIQKQAIPVVLQGRDVMGIAQTGTGKTAGFTLPMIDILSQGRARARMPRSLILEPTRELAAQVAESFDTYGKYHKLSMALLIGGVSFEDQNKLLDRGVDVLIATPGRLLDHFERGRLMMSGVEILVVDEADRMLDMGFIPDIERICKLMPQRHQTLFFSATMPAEIQKLSDTFLDDPKRIEVAKPTSAADTVEQFLCMEKSKEPKAKRNHLRRLIDGEDIGNGIVFCNRKKDVDIVAKSLKKHGHNAAALHGDMDQLSRMKVLDGFKSNEIQILVASDVAARGLDIPAVSHVFNYDVPNHSEDYIHRIGRTGRAGRSGRAFTIASPLDGKFLAALHDMLGRKIPLFKEEEAEAVDQMLEDTPKPKRRGRRRRSGDKSGDKKAEAPAKTEAAETTTDKAEDAERTEDRKARRNGRSNRRSRDKDTRQDKPAARRNEYGDRIPEPNGIKGLGDHTPAFLLQPVVLPKSKKSADDEDEKKEKATKPKKAASKKSDKKDSKKSDKKAEKKAAPKKRASRKKKDEEPAAEAKAETETAPSDTPAENPVEAPADAVTETVAETPADTPVETATDEPVETPPTTE